MKNHSYYREKLDSEKKLVISELREVGVVKNSRNPDDWEATPSNDDTSRADANEVADRLESYEQNNAIVQKLEARLTEIDHALTRMKENKYGICEVGGEHIEEGRLEANPAATTCKAHMK